MSFTPIPMNAARICDGLSKIGYTPSSAIRDIIDNAIQAKAQRVYVRIVREQKISDARLNNVKEYQVIDDGIGMDKPSLINALALGSSPDDYGLHSLSKFGLGMKSASFSQGEVLEVISSRGNGQPFLKYVVSLPEIRNRQEYGADDVGLSNDDLELITKYLPEGHGTIVRVQSVRKINHPSIKSILEDLRMKIGAVYYYMMSEDGLVIDIDEKECVPFDVLFTDEANQNGILDENDWDGKSTRWIEKPTKVTIDADNGVKATIEVTQLPYPPSFDRDGVGKQKGIRDKYMIGAGNYGFYVYRNRRLLSWAESFGLIPQDQDYYAFRGRIIIDNSGDDVFNIDVKKSQIHLSEEAYKTLDDLSSEYRKKSRKAWQRAHAELLRLTNEESLTRANTIAAQVDEIEELPGMPDSEEAYQEAERREQEIIEEQQKRVIELVSQEGSNQNTPDTQTGLTPAPTPEQIQRVVTGGQATPNDKIYLVTSTVDNALWEPYFETGKGTCVRINRLHRFARVIYEDNRKNGGLHILVGLMLLQMVASEKHLMKRLTKYKREDTEGILQEYRRVSSDMLAQLCRDVGDKLPSDD